MLRKGIAFAVLSIVGLSVFATSAKAQVANPWELTLGGNAANGPNFNGFSAGLNVGVGYYLSENLEIAGRQSLNYTDQTTPTALNASTRLAVDFHIPMGDRSQFVPYIGANIGYVYGDGVKNQFEGAPEGGIKYYVNDRTFIFADVEYQFFFNESSKGSQAVSNGQFVYGLGIGFRF